MTTAKIRVGQTEKIKIEVNDAGEFIEINTGDKRLVAKLTELMKKLKELAEETERVNAEKFQKLDPKTATLDDFVAAVNYETEAAGKIADWLDDVFGVGTCRKVFGEGVIPTLDNVQDFLNQLTPHIMRAVQMRRNSIGGKYAPSRRGGI